MRKSTSSSGSGSFFWAFSPSSSSSTESLLSSPQEYGCVAFSYNFYFKYSVLFNQLQIMFTFSGISSLYPVSSGEERMHQHNHQEDKDGGLVPAVHAGAQHRLDHLQGGCARAGQEAWLPQ